MRKIIHWIYIPTTTCAVVRVCGNDTIHDRITEVHVWISHINLRTEYHLTVLNLTVLHSLEQTEILLYWTITIWRSYTRFCRCTFLLCNLFCSLFVNICFPLLNKLNSKIVKLLKIVRSVINVSPFEPQPSNILLDRVHILYILFDWIGIVKTKVADTVIFFSNTKVHTYSLHVTDM